MAPSKGPEAAVEDTKGPAVRRGARSWRLARLLGRAVPGLPAPLVEVMLSDLPPSPATAAAPGRLASACGASKISGARRFPSGCSLTKEELHAPHELRNSAL